MSREQLFCAAAALFPVAVLLLGFLIQDALAYWRFGDRLKRIEQDLYGTRIGAEYKPNE